MNGSELDVIRQYQPPTHKLKSATWSFEIRLKPSGRKVWGGSGFLSEKSREQAIELAVSTLGARH